MLEASTRAKIVEDLFGVYRDRRPMGLISKAYPGIEVEDAYRIQEAFVARRVAALARVVIVVMVVDDVDDQPRPGRGPSVMKDDDAL